MLRKITDIVREAGEIMIDRQDIKPIEKDGPGNFVTEYDLRVQRYLHTHLAEAFPEAGFLSEEDDGSEQISQADWLFIIDPIDGTSNFICDYKISAISVALLLKDEVQLAVVYNPYTKEMFTAEKSKGAWLNETPLAVKERDLKFGIVDFGSSPYNEQHRHQAFALAEKLSYHALDTHRLGSAAISICYVAANRNIMYFDFELSPWDYAAASLIVKEAGGQCTEINGEALGFNKKHSFLACPHNIYYKFQDVRLSQ